MKPIPALLLGSALILPAAAYLAFRPEPAAVVVEAVAPAPAEVAAGAGQPAKDGSLELTALKAQVQSLGQDLAQLKADLAALRKALPAPQAPRTVARAPLDPAQERQQLLAQRAQEEAMWQQQSEQLEVAFQQQTRDPVWSAKAESLIQTALSQDKVAAEHIADIHCRASMCRLELTQAEGEQLPKIDSFPALVGEELPNVTVNQTTEQDGSTTTVLYLSREDAMTDGSGVR